MVIESQSSAPWWVRVLLLACLTLGSAVAHANEGKPSYKDPTLPTLGTDAQGIPEVTVRRERLSFDIRPAAEHEPPVVVAHYELDNEGPALTVPLVFASFLVDGGTVRFDDREVPARPLSSEQLPPAWETPQGLAPSVTARQPDASGLAFTLEIPPGRHELEVRYLVDDDFSDWNAGGWAIRYALAPARSWKAIESLELSVECPPGWTCDVYDGLHRNPREARRRLVEGDRSGTLRGQWSGLPGDGLTIFVLSPPPWWLALAVLVIEAAAMLLLLGMVFISARWMSTATSLGGRVVRWIPLAFVVVSTSCGCGILLSDVDSWTESSIRGYAQLEWMARTGFLGVVAAIVGVPLVSMVLRHARRREIGHTDPTSAWTAQSTRPSGYPRNEDR